MLLKELQRLPLVPILKDALQPDGLAGLNRYDEPSFHLTLGSPIPGTSGYLGIEAMTARGPAGTHRTSLFTEAHISYAA